MSRRNRVLLEVLRSNFVASAEAMGYALERTSHTTFVKESQDFATGISTPDGEIFAYPRNMGVTSFVGLSLEALVKAYPDPAPGDVIIANDPYTTAGLSTHLPDIHLVSPIYVDDELVAFSWAFIHCSDVGGAVAASIFPSAHEIHQEGLRIPPSRLYRRGELVEELRDLLLANTRTPAQNWGDIKAMLAALNKGAERFIELTERFGCDTVRWASRAVLDWSEESFRAAIRKLPEGSSSFTDYLDDDGRGDPIRLKATVTVGEADVHVDLTGSDPQVAAAFNLPAFGERHPLLLQGLLNFVLSDDEHIPLTGGIVRPFRVTAPPGSVVNPEFPSSVGVRYATVMRLYGVVLGALSGLDGVEIPAAGAAQGAMVVLSVPDLESGSRLVNVLEPIFGGGGATWQADGESGIDSSAGYLRNTPVESIETHIPVLTERYELEPDSAGPGRYRGGWGVRFDFRVLTSDAIVTARGLERMRFEPWGLADGHPAGLTEASINPDQPDEVTLDGIDVLNPSVGDTVSIRVCGGAGHGSPLRRPVSSVLRDFEDGLLSAEQARVAYGVHITPAGDIEEAATKSERGNRLRESSTLDPRFGPARMAYEDQWPEDVQEELISFLMTLPVAVRAYAKTELRQRLDERRPWSQTIDQALLRDLWDEFRLVNNDA